MSSYNIQNRYRRRNNERFAAFLFVFIILIVSFGLGFWIGGQAAHHNNRALESRLQEVTVERDTLQSTVTELRAETQTAQARYQQLQQTYKEVLPEGPLRDLVTMLKQQLDEGRDPERLSFLIRSARPPRNCTEPETKRFVVSTPAYEGPDSQISIAEGALIITAHGISAMNASGHAEAWYDPTKAVDVEFTTPEGIKEKKTGMFPMNHSVVVENREYRLTIGEGARSFAKVTFDSCDYP